MATLRRHLPEYLCELAAVALFMGSATGFATAFQHPASSLAGYLAPSPAGRVPMGLAMGLTAIALIYSPLGGRSGAHMNPAVTLTFLRLGKIGGIDAAAYVAAQFAGAIAGSAAAVRALHGLPAHPSVNFIVTAPGAAGTAAAFVAELAIAGVLMLTVLVVSNSASHAKRTGLAAGALVSVYIVFEAPLSGMSMNAARSFAPALLSGQFAGLWIYFVAPALGMLAAAELFVRSNGLAAVRCAKLHHPAHVRCAFDCAGANPARLTETPV